MESSNKNQSNEPKNNLSNVPNHVNSNSLINKKPISREGNKALEIVRPFFETGQKINF